MVDDPVLGASRTLALLTGIVGVLVSPAAAGAMVVNPDAEQEGGWSGSGARSAAYGDGPDVPSAQFAAEQRVGHHQRGLGARLFALGPEGRLEQVVDVPAWAAGIDAGTAPLYFGAWLGADGPAQGGARLVATPLDADGRELAAGAVAGPPTQADRASLAVMVPCGFELTPPAGTRGVRLALEGVGSYQTAGADAVHFADHLRPRTLEPYPTLIGWPTSPGQGPGCLRWDPTARWPSIPALPPKPVCSRHQPRTPRAQSSAQPTPAYPAPPVPTPQPAPRLPACVSPLRISGVVLTRTRLSLRVSRPASVRVRLARRAARPGAAKWRRVRSLVVRARSAGRATRAIRRLRPGRYRISIHARSAGTSSIKRTLRRTLKR